MANFSLLAKFGADTHAFENGVKRAEKRVSGFGRAIGKIGPALASVASVTALTAMTRGIMESAKEIKNLSLLAGENAEDFQRMAHAAQTVGISQEKLADILKDVNDKVGDFIQTGGGPMADFFEKIAPKVGVTAEQFKNLSGKQALQLYVDSLEKANLSQSDMTFYMEAIASDATALLPLLKDNGKAFDELGGKIGSVISNEEIEKIKRASDALETLKTKAKAFGAGILVDVMETPKRMANFRGMKSEGRFIAKQQLESEGAFDGLRGVKGQEQKQLLINERVKANKAIQKQEEEAAKKKAADEKAAAEELAKMKSGKFYEPKSREEKQAEDIEALRDRIKDKQLELLKAQADGDKESEKSLKNRVRLMERALGIMAKFDTGLEESARLAFGELNSNKKPGAKGEQAPTDTRGDFAGELTGHDLRRAANEAADKGTRFEKMADGTFQKYVNGSQKGRFTEAQMQAGLEKKIEKDPTEKTLNDIKSILEGKFVNE